MFVIFWNPFCDKAKKSTVTRGGTDEIYGALN